MIYDLIVCSLLWFFFSLGFPYIIFFKLVCAEDVIETDLLIFCQISDIHCLPEKFLMDVAFKNCLVVSLYCASSIMAWNLRFVCLPIAL